MGEGDEGEVLNHEAREQVTEQKEKVAWSPSFRCSPAMATCDGMYAIDEWCVKKEEEKEDKDEEEDEEEDFEKL